MTMLRLLKNRDFALLWVGSTVSLLGDGVYFVAIAWQVYQLENRPSALALVGVAWTLPQLACVVFAGVVTDRFDRRRVMIVANGVSGFAIATMAILAISGALQLWQLWILVAVYGVSVALFLPAASAVVPELVSSELLVEANALRQFVRPLTMRLIGPALGGVLVALLGAGEALLADSLTFFFAAGTLLLIRSGVGRRAASQGQSFAREAADGLRFVRSQSWLWLSLLAAAAWLLLYVGPVEVLLPFLVKNKIGSGSRGLGLVFAAGGLGAMVCSWLVATRGLPRRPLVLMYVVWSLGTFALATLALATTLWQAMLSNFFVFGFASMGDIVWQTTLQRRVPNELLGRVASIDWLVSAGLVPVSFVVVGPVAGTIGSSATLLGAGLLGGVFLASIIALPPIREPEPSEYAAAAHA
jgi:MFS family permease